jgi:hypothetical protein
VLFVGYVLFVEGPTFEVLEESRRAASPRRGPALTWQTTTRPHDRGSEIWPLVMPGWVPVPGPEGASLLAPTADEPLRGVSHWSDRSCTTWTAPAEPRQRGDFEPSHRTPFIMLRGIIMNGVPGTARRIVGVPVRGGLSSTPGDELGAHGWSERVRAWEGTAERSRPSCVGIRFTSVGPVLASVQGWCTQHGGSIGGPDGSVTPVPSVARTARPGRWRLAISSRKKRRARPLHAVC